MTTQTITTERLNSAFKRCSSALLVFGFLAVLVLPMADLLLDLDPVPAPHENRAMAKMPGLPKSLDELLQWPQAAEASFNDHFGFRSLLLQSYIYTRVEVFGESPNARFMLGKDDWTFLAYEPAIFSHRKARRVAPESLQKMAAAYVQAQEFCRGHGAEFIATWGPDKATIYPEQLPSWFKTIGEKSYMDFLYEHMRAHPEITLVDLRPVLLQEKQNHQLYYPAESHWNKIGGYFAYKALSDEISKKVPHYRTLPADRVTFVQRPVDKTDPTVEISLPRYQKAIISSAVVNNPKGVYVGKTLDGLDKDNPLVIRIFENPDKTLPTAVIYHDSFYSAMLQYLIESFSRVVFVHDSAFPEEIIALEKPDIVMQLHVERSLFAGKIFGL